MKMHNKSNKINYEMLCDYLLHSISVMEAKNYNTDKIINNIMTVLNDKLVHKTGDFEKYLSPKMMRMIDKFTDKLSAVQTLSLVKKAVDYDRETSYFQKVKNAFTIIAYYINGDALDKYKTDYIKLMQKDK